MKTTFGILCIIILITGIPGLCVLADQFCGKSYDDPAELSAADYFPKYETAQGDFSVDGVSQFFLCIKTPAGEKVVLVDREVYREALRKRHLRHRHKHTLSGRLIEESIATDTRYEVPLPVEGPGDAVPRASRFAESGR